MSDRLSQCASEPFVKDKVVISAGIVAADVLVRPFAGLPEAGGLRPVERIEMLQRRLRQRCRDSTASPWPACCAPRAPQAPSPRWTLPGPYRPVVSDPGALPPRVGLPAGLRERHRLPAFPVSLDDLLGLAGLN